MPDTVNPSLNSPARPSAQGTDGPQAAISKEEAGRFSALVHQKPEHKQKGPGGISSRTQTQINKSLQTVAARAGGQPGSARTAEAGGASRLGAPGGSGGGKPVDQAPMPPMPPMPPMTGKRSLGTGRSPDRGSGRSTGELTAPQHDAPPELGRQPQGAGYAYADRATASRDEGDPHTVDPKPDAALPLSGNPSAQAPDQPGQAVPVEAPMPASPREVSETINRMVDRILVSVPQEGKPGEVHIKLKDSLLDGTTVRLSRGGDGQLNVNFVATTENAKQFLVQNSESLSSALSSRLDGAQVAVAVAGSTDQRQSDAGANDGRSRQRYEPAPEQPED